MPLEAGKLRHRVVIQSPVATQDQDTGEALITWSDIATVWAEIAPISAREFVASDREDSKITTRITIRYRDDIDASMRLYHASKDFYYNIEGILSDRDSGLEYLTLPCSEGIRYTEENQSVVAPVNLIAPSISGTAQVGQTVTVSNGTWANSPSSYSYQWYRQGAVAITGATNSTYLLSGSEEGLTVYCSVTATNEAGSTSVNTAVFGPISP